MTSSAAQAVWEWMGAQGFEQAHTPTDDERDELELQDLATVIGNVVIDYEDTGPHSQRPITIRDACADLPMEIAGEVRAAGFRRTVQGEPTDAQVQAFVTAINAEGFVLDRRAVKAGLRAACDKTTKTEGTDRENGSES